MADTNLEVPGGQFHPPSHPRGLPLHPGLRAAEHTGRGHWAKFPMLCPPLVPPAQVRTLRRGTGREGDKEGAGPGRMDPAVALREWELGRAPCALGKLAS